ncbi:MAG: hypothetical protein D6741_21355 [Planctomycetota bacterium]|nr:MAG: hypothetical protein D6741_21355 [Planctomycetota bacterium]
MSTTSTKSDYKVRRSILCPHCWHTFPVYDILFIAEHPELLGDPRLGNDYQRRFRPSRFTPNCEAIDPKGMPCNKTACPNCHLEIPRGCIELAPRIVSVIGAPACGKSYFITSQAWMLRNVLSRHFHVSFADADPLINQRLNEYETLLFLNQNNDELVELPKTETFGEHYSSVLFGSRSVQFLKPFLFTLKPLRTHPNAAAMQALGRLLCIYDNAGESFLPGQETGQQPVTRHLSESNLFMFLFDPTQDVRFARALQEKAEDDPASAINHRRVAMRQETVLSEAAQRIVRSTKHTRKEDRPPLIVVVTKYDAWRHMLDERLESPWRYVKSAGLCGVTVGQVERVSMKVRDLLSRLTPEIVNTAEDLCNRVVYVPVSATGCAPSRSENGDRWGFRPKDITPIWTEVPLLYYLAKWERGIIGQAKESTAMAVPPGVENSSS